MGTVLRFEPVERQEGPGRAKSARQNASARLNESLDSGESVTKMAGEIVIFPGVRYSREADGVPSEGPITKSGVDEKMPPDIA